MLITKRAHGKVMVIHLAGKFEGGPDRERLLAMTDGIITEGYRKIVISFLGLRFIASTGVGILIAMKRRCDEVGGRMILCNLNERVLSVVHVLRMQEVFTLEKNIRTSLARFRGTRESEARA